MLNLTYAQAVELANDSSLEFGDILVAEQTPDYIVNLGCPQLPLAIASRHLVKAMSTFDDHGHNHGISAEVMAEIPEAINHPAFVFDSDKRPDSICLMLDLYDDFDQPILIGIHLNGYVEENGEIRHVNYITSIYGKRRDGACGQYSRALKENRLLYVCRTSFMDLCRCIDISMTNRCPLSDTDEIVVSESRCAYNVSVNADAYNARYASRYATVVSTEEETAQI